MVRWVSLLSACVSVPRGCSTPPAPGARARLLERLRRQPCTTVAKDSIEAAVAVPCEPGIAGRGHQARHRAVDRPTFSTVSSMPGIDTGAPERTETTSGRRRSPRPKPVEASSAATVRAVSSLQLCRRAAGGERAAQTSVVEHHRLGHAQAGAARCARARAPWRRSRPLQEAGPSSPRQVDVRARRRRPRRRPAPSELRCCGLGARAHAAPAPGRAAVAPCASAHRRPPRRRASPPASANSSPAGEAEATSAVYTVRWRVVDLVLERTTVMHGLEERVHVGARGALPLHVAGVGDRAQVRAGGGE